MTYVEKGVINDVITVPELILRIYDNNSTNNINSNNINNNNEGYIHLSQCDDRDDNDDDHNELTVENECLIEESTARVRWCFIWKWIKLFVLFVVLAGLALVFFKWVGPFLMDKGIIPIINWERASFSTPHLVLIVFVTVSLFPTICLPSTPSMWVAGMTFGYGFGFLLIMPAVTIGVSLPYLIGHLFHHKIQGWMERYPKKASLIRLAGEGGWMDQFQAVALIRISPFPYIIYNYCAVATNVKYGPYILGSMVGMVPEVLVAIYTGILIKTLADASDDNHSLSAQEIILNVVGFAATVATTIICTILAKKRLKTMPIEDEPLLQ